MWVKMALVEREVLRGHKEKKCDPCQLEGKNKRETAAVSETTVCPNRKRKQLLPRVNETVCHGRSLLVACDPFIIIKYKSCDLSIVASVVNFHIRSLLLICSIEMVIIMRSTNCKWRSSINNCTSIVVH